MPGQEVDLVELLTMRLRVLRDSAERWVEGRTVQNGTDRARLEAMTEYVNSRYPGPAGLAPEQRAMMTLQMKKQRESLMTSVLTNIANMKHESLKGIAQNLRG